MPSPDQLALLQNPEILKAFFADVKTSEIQFKLDAIKAERHRLGLPEDAPVSESFGEQIRNTATERLLRGIALARKGSTY